VILNCVGGLQGQVDVLSHRSRIGHRDLKLLLVRAD
jgi:hypothetical protein